jgi:release factor glutamine methyltransferase
MDGVSFESLASISPVRDLLSQTARSLAAAGIESARLDAEVLLGYVLALTREQLLVADDLPISFDQLQQFAALLQRRLRWEPIAYITGRQEFWSLDFHVTQDVLIPRPETERLIEVAMALAADLGANKSLRVLDIGTGSGAVAVSLAAELPFAKIVATDNSLAALAVAQKKCRTQRSRGSNHIFTQ